MSQLKISLDEPLSKQIPTLFATIIFTSLAFVLALAWSKAFQKIFTDLFGSSNSTLGLLFYAITITFIVIILLYSYTKWNSDKINISIQGENYKPNIDENINIQTNNLLATVI